MANFNHQSNNKRIVIFASGGGSNAQAIINYFHEKPVEVSSIFTNNSNAGIIQRAEKHSIPCIVFDRKRFNSGEVLIQLQKIKPDLIILAGFLWLIPSEIVKAFPNKIINIHPALLPKYGGKGMHGMNVHRAVKEADEKESGLSIHYVNEKYDEGNIIHQAKCEIHPEDTPEDIASKVLKLEHENYPKVIEKLLLDK